MCPVPPSPVFRDQDATHAADFDNRGDRGKEGGVGSARLKGVKRGWERGQEEGGMSKWTASVARNSQLCRMPLSFPVHGKFVLAAAS